jgi:hypothetical protein
MPVSAGWFRAAGSHSPARAGAACAGGGSGAGRGTGGKA